MNYWSPRTGDVVVAADGGSFCGRVTLVTHATVHCLCLDTGQTFEKSRSAFLAQYRLLRESPTAHTYGYLSPAAVVQLEELDAHLEGVRLKHHPFSCRYSPDFPIALEDDEWEEP